MVDKSLVCVGALVRQKDGGLVGSRRQSDQVQIQAAHQSGLGRFGRRIDVLASEPGQDERIDWIPNPTGRR